MVNLIEHRNMAGLDVETLGKTLRAALRDGRFDAERLQRMAGQYGTRETRCGFRLKSITNFG